MDEPVGSPCGSSPSVDFGLAPNWPFVREPALHRHFHITGLHARERRLDDDGSLRSMTFTAGTEAVAAARRPKGRGTVEGFERFEERGPF